MRTLFPRASWIAAARSALAVVFVGLASAAMAQVPAVDGKAERAENSSPLPRLGADRHQQSARQRDIGRKLPQGCVRGSGHPGQDLRARAGTCQSRGAHQGERQQAAGSHHGAHRCRRRAAREMAGRPLRRGRQGRLHLGTRHQGRQGQAHRQSHHDVACEEARTFLSTATSSSSPRRARKAPPPWASISW